jgi:hypothetical protein
MQAYSIQTSLKSALRCILGSFISILGPGCVSTEKTVELSKEAPQPTHFVLDPAPVLKGDEPLPDLTAVYVKVYSQDQFIERRLAYKAWDFNKDGTADLLEYVDAQGYVIRRAYDFNSDGKVDREEP